jgi:hypothetical protein
VVLYFKYILFREKRRQLLFDGSWNTKLYPGIGLSQKKLIIKEVVNNWMFTFLMNEGDTRGKLM